MRHRPSIKNVIVSNLRLQPPVHGTSEPDPQPLLSIPSHNHPVSRSPYATHPAHPALQSEHRDPIQVPADESEPA